jgi:hypothetical protein
MKSGQFLKEGFSIKSNKFFEGFVPIKEITYCVVIVYDNNFKKEVYGITNPWQFMAALRKNPRIKNVYIKDENNP